MELFVCMCVRVCVSHNNIHVIVAYKYFNIVHQNIIMLKGSKTTPTLTGSIINAFCFIFVFNRPIIKHGNNQISCYINNHPLKSSLAWAIPQIMRLEKSLFAMPHYNVVFYKTVSEAVLFVAVWAVFVPNSIKITVPQYLFVFKFYSCKGVAVKDILLTKCHVK